MKIAVYTTNIGGFDTPIGINDNFINDADYFLFTDQKIEAKGFKTIIVKNDIDHARRTSRMYKICPHRYLEDYDIYFYIDGNIEMLVSPVRIIEKYLSGYEWAALKHPWRNCIYKEADECVRIGYILPDKAKLQMDFIRSNGYPENNGLTENGVTIRENTARTRKFAESWLEIYMKFTQRDQLSFMYCAWNFGLRFNLIQNDIRNKFPMEFKLKEHK